MKKIFVSALLIACSLSLMAQPQGGRGGERPDGERPEFKMPEVLSDSLYAASRTEEMIEKYSLTDEQIPAVWNLNFAYASKLQFSPMSEGLEKGERKDPRSMSESERNEFFRQMQQRMAEMQEANEIREENQKAYDNEIKEILTKDQFKAYRKDRKKEENERQKTMGGRGGRMGGPGGGPGGRGGFGGPGGGFGGN